MDDNFFVKIDRVREIFKNTEKMGVKFTWDAECRIDYVKEGFLDDNMFRFLKRNGLVQLTFGIESGSKESLRRMRKGGNAGPEYAVAAIRKCAEHGIASRGSFILDIPGDTRKDIIDTVKLIRKLRAYDRFACGVHTYRPYPKSPLCQELIKAGKFYQPTALELWENEKSVRQYTDITAKRAWQTNYRLSSKVSFYESLESAFWIKPHQIRNSLIRWINSTFINLASFRNRHQFYSISIDKFFYIRFKDFCIKHILNKSENK